MADSIRTAIVGAGSLGLSLGRQLSDIEGVDVTAVADVNDEARRRAADGLDADSIEGYDDYGDMLRTESLDAVVVATPHALHYEQVVAAMDRDLHVLCEKPLTTDLDRARDLVRRENDHDRVLMVGYQRHLDPAFVAAREWLADRDPPKVVTAEITQDWIERFRGTWRTDPDLSGGGQLYDTGSHLLDALLWTTGLTPKAVAADMVFDDDDRRVDRQAVLTVRFAEGTVATVTVSGDAPVIREHLRVWGKDGGVYVDGVDWEPREVRVVTPSGEETPPLDGYDAPSKGEAFVSAIRNGREPPAGARDALAVTALTEAAYESARNGRTVPVEIESVETAEMPTART